MKKFEERVTDIIGCILGVLVVIIFIVVGMGIIYLIEKYSYVDSVAVKPSVTIVEDVIVTLPDTSTWQSGEYRCVEWRKN